MLTDDVLVTRLQNFFSQHQTTDDSKSIDYDYSIDDEDSKDPTHFTLPLAPISDENDTSVFAVNEPESSTVQYQIELHDFSFRKPNDTQDITDSPSAAAPTDVSDENFNENVTAEDQGNSSEVNENSTTLRENATHVDESNINFDENDTTTVESAERIDTTLETEAPETTSRDSLSFDDQLDEDNNYSTTSGELVINKSESFYDDSQAEKTINDTSSSTAPAIQLEDYFDAILLNDSLLIDETSSDENATETDFDFTTMTTITHWPDVEESDGSANETDVDETIAPSTTAPFLSTTTIENSFTPFSDFPYENPIIKDDQQNADLENVEASNKFVYHHLSATQSLSDENIKNSLATPSTVVRFPAQVEERQRVRFPDDPLIAVTENPPIKMSFSWPRDNGYQTVGLMRFWQQQPLINDFKFVSRGNSRGPGAGFNRQQAPYRRNYQ